MRVLNVAEKKSGSEIRDKTCFDLISYGFELRHINCRDCIHENFLLVLFILLFYTSTCYYILLNMQFGMQPFVYMIIYLMSCPECSLWEILLQFCFKSHYNQTLTDTCPVVTDYRGLKRLEKVFDYPAKIDYLNLLSPSSTLDAYQQCVETSISMGREKRNFLVLVSLFSRYEGSSKNPGTNSSVQRPVLDFDRLSQSISTLGKILSLSCCLLSQDNAGTAVSLSQKVALSHPVGNPS